MSIKSESYDAIHERYSNTIEWMAEIGVKLGPNRVARYDKVLREWKQNYKTDSKHEGKVIFPDFVSSIFEIYDFVDVYSAFNDIPKESLTAIVTKLNKGVNGPTNAAEETPKTTEARNYFFEAAVAARFHRPFSGIEAILDADTDTGVRIDKSKVWVECKRVTTPDKISNNVQKATKQLESALKNKVGCGHRAMVALDVSKILNKGDMIFVKNSESEFPASVDAIMDDFVEEYSNIWHSILERRNPKIIGVIIRFAFMTSVEDRNLLVHTSQWAVNPRQGLSKTDEQLQRILVKSLTHGIRQ